MKNPACCLALPLILLLFSWQAFPASLQINSLEEPVSLAGQWLFQPGDQADWANPDFDDSDWSPVTVPDFSPAGYPGHNGLGWYRLTLEFDLQNPLLDQQLGALGVTLGSVESAYEFYVGGEKLGGVGGLPPDSHIRYDQHQTYFVPRSAIDEQGRLVLAMRVWRYEGVGDGRESGPFSGPYLVGNIGDLRAAGLQSSLVPNIIMAALYLAVGLYHLLIAKRNPALKEFFWFGWFAIALSIYSFETTQWKYSLDISFLLHKKLEYASLYLMPFLFTAVLVRVVNFRLNIAGRIVQYLFLVYALSIVLVPNIDVHYFTLPSLQYLAMSWTICLAVILIWHAFKGNRAARAFVGIMLLLVAALVNNVVLSESVLGGINILHFVYALIILLMAVLMANRYTETLAKLERTVEEHTADLRNTNLQLQQAVATKSQFLANMSHELRTPMNAIIGLTHLGLKTELTEQQREYLNTVDHSAHGLLGIIESILDFTRLESGELTLAEEPFLVSELLQRLTAVASPAAEEKGLDIRYDQDPEIPAALIGDALRLGQLLTILTSNAIKFTEQGEVVVSLVLEEQGVENARLRFAVSDTGIGIEAAQRKQLFEAFSQADDSHTREHGGAGLGLAIAQDLVRLMGTRIEVESEPGQGSRFSFSLQLPISTVHIDAREPPGTGEELDLTLIQGARVLLVDDSEINLQVAGEILRQAQLRVDTALNGQLAVDLVHENDYDCVLMDVQMPVMDGYTATETLRADSRFENLPILAMTANVLAEDKARATEAGMNAHIPKPIDPEELYRQLLIWIKPGEREPLPATIEETAPEITSLPEELPGLQLTEGMSRVGGNAKLYISLLRDLRKDYARAGTNIQELANAGDSDGAAQLAHKLRGIANNLGANEVGSQAESIEAGLRAGQAPPPDAFQSLIDALAVLTDSIDQLQALTTGAADSEALDENAVQALLAQLQQEIGESNPAAGDTVEQLLQGLDESNPATEPLTACGEALDSFDFAAAAEHLSRA
jgi:signal transduction histidine kinase/CheY-like chemotaxis protein